MKFKAIISTLCIATALTWVPSLQAAETEAAPTVAPAAAPKAASKNDPVAKAEADKVNRESAESASKAFMDARDSAIKACLANNAKYIAEEGCSELPNQDKGAIRKILTAAKKACKTAGATWIVGTGCHFKE